MSTLAAPLRPKNFSDIRGKVKTIIQSRKEHFYTAPTPTVLQKETFFSPGQNCEPSSADRSAVAWRKE
jgi:hypothetical protein